MSIQTTSLFTSMVRQFNTNVADDRFQKDFVQALNVCLDELSFCAALDTPIAHVQSHQTIISGLDEDDMFILQDGLVVRLTESGREPVGGESQYDRAKVNWEDRKGDFMVKQSRDLQATEDDDGVPTSDVVGLGYDQFE
jgi:hypothetical protein